MKSLKDALYYRRLNNDQLQCVLCPRRCIIPEGGRSFCRNRENRAGKLYTLSYGNPCTLNMAGPENAPLYHFIPGHNRLALAAVGCNLRCRYCQNWQISQAGAVQSSYFKLSPKEAVELAMKKKAKSISFTYTEPVASYEYVLDISKLARERGLMTSIVSNGFINQEPLREILQVMDAVNIDLKGFSNDFYRYISSGELEPVLNTLKMVREEKVYLEIVNLIVPTINDDPDIITQMCGWVRKNLGDDVPLHFTRYFPNYRLTDIPPTPVKTLELALAIARDAGLKYVYIGNVPGHDADNTFCANCEKLLVRRYHFDVLENNVNDGSCKFCGESIPGIWQ
jgi:pyruvate formate lyase activating enzyme